MNLKYHKLTPSDSFIEKSITDPSSIGLSEADFIGMNESQRRLKIIGEYYYRIWVQLGFETNEMLMMSAWGGEIKPNWFDHRAHLLDIHHYIDYWTISSDNVLRVLPLGGRLLSLCSGDGFYEWMFYSRRASEITAIDCNPSAIRHANRLYNHKAITFLQADIFAADINDAYYDVVCIRGAIEHFTKEDQVKIIHLAHSKLKPGGYFVGDTPASQGEKMHSDHENEWKNAAEMEEILRSIFNDIETITYTSKDRTTLIWKCRK